MTLCTIADGTVDENWEQFGHLFRGFSSEFESYMDQRDDGHERPAGIHASEITGCLRSAAYTVLGTQKKGIIDRFWRNKFEHGHYVHAGLQLRLHQMAEAQEARYVFEDEVSIRPDNNELAADWNIYSSCDGVVTFIRHGQTVARMGIEIKTESAAQYDKLVGPRPYHVEQVHVYMACLDLPATWVWYYNKGNENTKPSTDPYLVKFDPLIWNEIVNRMTALYGTVNEGNLPDRSPGIWCEWCRYAWTCRTPWGRKPRDTTADDEAIKYASGAQSWAARKESR